MKITFLRIAEAEFGEAIDDYNNQKEGLGDEFFDEVWSAIERIDQFPNAWQTVGKGVRRCQTNRFPYGVIYQTRNESEILIIAVSHLHRKPGRWKNRL